MSLAGSAPLKISERPTFFFAWSWVDALFASLMVGIGESYFAAFALSKGFSEVSAGLLTTLPLVLGAFVPLAFVHWVSLVRSLKKWVVWSAGFQAVSLLGLVLASMLPEPPLVLVFSLATLYFAGGFMVAPAWNFWMGSLIEGSEVSSFFAQRLRLTQLGLFLGLLFGGVLLHHPPEFMKNVSVMPVFGVLFILAFVFRLASMISLIAQKDSSEMTYPESFNLSQSVKLLLSRSGALSFFVFLFVFYMVIFVTSPFVNPFFLVELKFDYQKYMIALVALMVGKAMSLPWGARWIQRFGTKRIFLIGALGISPLPALWAFERSFEFALLLQWVSGIFWALFELSFSVIFFSHLKAKEKIPFLSLHQFFNSAAILCGSLIGAYILHTMPDRTMGYGRMFIFGSCLRLTVVGFFIWYVRKQKKFFQDS